jgi:hypothetical protein
MRCVKRLHPLTAIAAVGGMAALVLTLAAPAVAADGAQPAAGFVLLSPEQASSYSGSQLPLPCTGTGRQLACTGISVPCPDRDWFHCQSATTYNSDAVYFCESGSTGDPGTCTNHGLVFCYQVDTCHFDPIFFKCVIVTTGTPVHTYDATCDVPEPTPPEPQPG